MKAPIPHLILLYATLVQSLKVVTKRGSGKIIFFSLIVMTMHFPISTENMMMDPKTRCKHLWYFSLDRNVFLRIFNHGWIVAVAYTGSYNYDSIEIHSVHINEENYDFVIMLLLGSLMFYSVGN